MIVEDFINEFLVDDMDIRIVDFDDNVLFDGFVYGDLCDMGMHGLLDVPVANVNATSDEDGAKVVLIV